MYYLLIPRSFLVLLKKNKQEARAMLAHELSHVYQKDPNLWVVTDTVFAILARATLPFSLIVFLQSLTFTSTPGLLIVNSVNMLLSALFVVDVRRARRTSEYTADCFAGHMTSFPAIDNSVSWFGGDGSPLHPTTSERLKRIATRNFETAHPQEKGRTRTLLIVLALSFGFIGYMLAVTT
jgi:hypothetical protein